MKEDFKVLRRPFKFGVNDLSLMVEFEGVVYVGCLTMKED